MSTDVTTGWPAHDATRPVMVFDTPSRVERSTYESARVLASDA